MPWFKTEFQPETPHDFMSDDVWFCNLARKHGHEVWLDHDLSQEIGHIGSVEFHHGLTPAESVTEGGSVDLVDMCKTFVGSS
jgi:hypothetical protein